MPAAARLPACSDAASPTSPSICPRSRSISSCCRGSTASPPSASPCNCSRWPRFSCWQPASWARQWATGSNVPRRRRSSSSQPVFRSSSWRAFPGHGKQPPSRSSPRATYSLRIWPSTAWCALISWVQPCGKWRATGAASGPRPSFILRSLRSQLFSSSGGAGMASRRRSIVALGLILIAAGAGAYILWPRGEAAPIVGVVRATQIRVAPEVGGQLAAIKVRKGDRVRAGEVVAELSALELSAAVVQARAALEAASAQRDHVYAGVRAEEVAALAAAIAKAKSRLEYAQLQLTRTAYLARSDTATQQSLDQAENDAASARADVAEAEANHAAAVAGPTREERAIADAQVKAAASALAVLERRLAKTSLHAPADGIVSVIVAEVGENVSAGQPVLAITATGKQWLSFNAREDLLRGLSVGATINIARSGAPPVIPAVVTELLPLGSFATWQAQRAVGDHDLNTLRLRLDLQGDPADFEPGMTVWLKR